MQNTIYDVIIVGAGASGLLCARECARGGLKTLVLEKEQTPGRKILATGNGRCNLTNARVAPAFYHGEEKLISSALSQFSYTDCRAYFEDLGILLTEEENRGAIRKCTIAWTHFPANGQIYRRFRAAEISRFGKRRRNFARTTGYENQTRQNF